MGNGTSATWYNCLMTKMSEILASLDKDTQKKIQVASKVEVRRLPNPSLGITKELRGGLRFGGVHLYWGPTGSGKTLNAYETLALAQKMGYTCALVDSETAFTNEWAEQLGIDTSELAIITTKSMELATNQVMKLLKAGVDVVLIDSVSELTPPGEFEKDSNELKEMSGLGAIGTQARGIRAMLGKLTNVLGDSMIIMISQQTTEITSNGGIQKPQGGNRMAHVASTSIKFGSPMAEKNRKMGDVTEGDLIFQKVTGRPVNWQITKERGPGMHAKGNYDIYFAGDFVGIDKVGELVDYGIHYGIIKQGGAWLTVYDHKVQGRDNAIKYVRENQEVRDTLEAELLAK
jgi:recombination protein RecA